MSNRKVPCGGFGLDENFLGMNENGELSLVGGASEDKAYKQLVTDGTGTAKWEDRLAYTETKLTEIVPEATVTFSDMGGLMEAAFPESFEPLNSVPYRITWDGETYECFLRSDFEYPALGNLSILNVGDDTGEPFVLLYNGTSWTTGTANTSTSHLISISGLVETVKKMDAKCMGLFVLPIYSDDKSGVSVTVSYDDVKAAFNAKIPIFAQRYVSYSGAVSEVYSCEEILDLQSGISFLFPGKKVTYNKDGTITEEERVS